MLSDVWRPPGLPLAPRGGAPRAARPAAPAHQARAGRPGSAAHLAAPGGRSARRGFPQVEALHEATGTAVSRGSAPRALRRTMLPAVDARRRLALRSGHHHRADEAPRWPTRHSPRRARHSHARPDPAHSLPARTRDRGPCLHSVHAVRAPRPLEQQPAALRTSTGTVRPIGGVGHPSAKPTVTPRRVDWRTAESFGFRVATRATTACQGHVEQARGRWGPDGPARSDQLRVEARYRHASRRQRFGWDTPTTRDPTKKAARPLSRERPSGRYGRR